MIPVFGPLFSELINTFIPNQRLDRIGRLMLQLEEKLADVSKERLDARFRDPAFVDLLEDAMMQTARALDPDRVAQIASLLKNSIADEEVHRLRDKRLLGLLGELNEVEVLILSSHLGKYKDNPEFLGRHGRAITRPLECYADPNNDVDALALYDEQISHMVRLGLLRLKFHIPAQGESYMFDAGTGTMRSTGHAITQLGTLLLRRIDVAEKGEG
jgi:hypothetical protein